MNFLQYSPLLPNPTVKKKSAVGFSERIYFYISKHTHIVFPFDSFSGSLICLFFTKDNKLTEVIGGIFPCSIVGVRDSFLLLLPCKCILKNAFESQNRAYRAKEYNFWLACEYHFAHLLVKLNNWTIFTNAIYASETIFFRHSNRALWRNELKHLCMHVTVVSQLTDRINWKYSKKLKFQQQHQYTQIYYTVKANVNI